MPTTARKTATTVAAIAALGFGGATIADAADNSDGSSANRPARGSDQRESLSSDVAAKVEAAALAEVPGATVLRAEAGGPYATRYHAHIETADGTRQVVLVNASFEATTVQAERARSGRRSRDGGPRGAALSSDVAAKVKAAALEDVPGATVLRSEAGGPYATKYHAHIETADGSRKVVLVNASFQATAVQAERARNGGRGPGGMGESALTGTTKEQVEAAVLAEYPGATIERTETNADDAAPYEAHITTSDGEQLEVLVSDDFKVVETRRHP